MIISGYQGIGKSSLVKNDFGKYIDLESSNFFVNGVRPDNWHEIYVNIAKHLSDQGYRVFISSHKVVRDCLNERGIKFITISPSIFLKDKWIEKLQARYNSTKSDKDYKALMNAKTCYEENIVDLQQEKYTLVLNGMDYRLDDLIEWTYGRNKWIRFNHPDYFED